jgi:hypothetical protein
MVDSLSSSKSASAASSGGGAYSHFAGSMSHQQPPTSKPAPPSSSAGSSSSGSIYPGLLDPALASYYSSLYTPHMFGLPSGHPFMNPNVFAPHHMVGGSGGSGNAGSGGGGGGSSSSNAAAEVTAQVYKDLVQRGYPPALAPGLPPHLSGALANLPGLNSLGAFASMYSSLGGKEGRDPASERTLPKS